MQIEAYLTFGGNCEEALAFYRQCLGGDIVTLKASKARRWTTASCRRRGSRR